MLGPEQNRDHSAPEPSPEFDQLWSQLLSPVALAPGFESLRKDFVTWLVTQPEFGARTDCSNDSESVSLAPLTALDRQLLSALEEHFESLILDASGGECTLTVVGRFGYTNKEGEAIRSLLVKLEDRQGLPVLYDGYTNSVNQTQGIGLAEVLRTPTDAVFIRQHLSVESVQHEIGEFVANWPAYFRVTGERKTSPIASSLWAQATSNNEALDEVLVPDNVTLYAREDPLVYHVRFDIGELAAVVTASCRGSALRPALSNYVMDRPLLDASLARVKPEMNELGEWTFVPDKLLSAADALVFSSTLRSLSRTAKDFGIFLPNLFTSQPEVPLRNERMVSQFLYQSGEQDRVDAMRIDRIDLLTRTGREYLAFSERSAVGLVAKTRDGQFVLNSSYTRRTFEFGPAGVILLGGVQGIDRIQPFYSQAAFREELCELMVSKGGDVERLRGTSYLLHLAISACSGDWAGVSGGIERLVVESLGSNRDRATIILHGADRSFSALVERQSASGQVQTSSPHFPRFLRQIELW